MAPHSVIGEKHVYEHIKKTSIDYYEKTLAEYGDDPRGVNWRDLQSQKLRFKILCEIGDLTGKRLHDVGCGLGHLADYLVDQGIDCEYVGSDLSQAMIKQARQRLPVGLQLHVADILIDSSPSWMRADYVVASGLFNVKGDLDPNEWQNFVEAMILRMCELAGLGIAFNMMTSYVDYQDCHLFYLSPKEILDFCIRHLSRRVVIRHDYPLWEYTTYVYK